MPHQCVRCNTFYEDASDELLKGCKCGGKLFFYIRQESLNKSKQVVAKLTEEEKGQIEQDVFDIIGKGEPDQPVVLDLESIRVVKPGKYEIDLVQLFKGEPVIYRLEEGKYIIDLIKSFAAAKK